ncbi:MAG TPA: restriction endonuclease subunit R [Nostocaceae cyanobacterium]|nr:restriction endonuclease subunit R [Nostocaceae cyanobacterium]
MVQVIPSQNITLADLNKGFALKKSEDEQFFTEWLTDLPVISELEKQYLDRVKTNYLSLIEQSSPLKNIVKMVVLSPLLDLAGFYLPPFHLYTEEPIEICETVIIDEQNQPEIIKGKIDVLVIQNQLWLLVIESKRSTFSLAKAIPQALTYMLANPYPKNPVYSLVMNGEDFQFIKLAQKDNQPRYALSDRLTLYSRENELYTVLQILKKLGQSLSYV